MKGMACFSLTLNILCHKVMYSPWRKTSQIKWYLQDFRDRASQKDKNKFEKTLPKFHHDFKKMEREGTKMNFLQLSEQIKLNKQQRTSERKSIKFSTLCVYKFILSD